MCHLSYFYSAAAPQPRAVKLGASLRARPHALEPYIAIVPRSKVFDHTSSSYLLKSSHIPTQPTYSTNSTTATGSCPSIASHVVLQDLQRIQESGRNPEIAERHCDGEEHHAQPAQDGRQDLVEACADTLLGYSNPHMPRLLRGGGTGSLRGRQCERGRGCRGGAQVRQHIGVVAAQSRPKF